MSTHTVTRRRAVRPPAPGATAEAPRRRANLKALRLLRQEVPNENVGLKPKVYCWDCNRANEEQRGTCCARHVIRQCDECNSYITNAHKHITFVGHAETTDKFLDADLQWNWRPMALDERGLPAFDDLGGMWIYLTIGGVERLGYGSANGKRGPDAIKEVIGDALRNSGMRFGVGLDHWAKTDLHADERGSDGEAADLAAVQDGDAEAPDGPADPQYARPDLISRIGSLLALKRGAHGDDRNRILSEILRRRVDDVRTLTPDEAWTVIRRLENSPDHAPTPPSPPAAAALDTLDAPGDTPAEVPASAAVSPDPASAPAVPDPAPVSEPGSVPAAAATAEGPPVVGQPGQDGPADPTKTPRGLARAMDALFTTRGISKFDIAARLEFASQVLERQVYALDELSKADAEAVIHFMNTGQARTSTPAADEPEGPDAFTIIDDMIKHAASDDDARAILKAVGDALALNQITKSDAQLLHEKLEARGRKAGVP